MHKDELLELHEELLVIKEYFQDREEAQVDRFEEYDELEVHPSHVHKSKSEHKHAVFVLGNALAEAMSDDEFSNAGRISKRMSELATDAESKL
ncbi:MAG: UPF0058 family protein [Halobacteriales archaeon]|nr:UPF0058 family protein [Halobacteriales archaeon]